MTDISKLKKPNLWPWMVVGILALGVSVNFVMIYLALDTYKPLVVDNPYEHGLKYQEIVDQELNFTRSGWDIAFAVLKHENNQHILQARITDSANIPATHLHVVVHALRPNASSNDRSIIIDEHAAGEYTATVPLLDSGLWLLDFVIEKDGKKYRLKANYLVQK